MTQLTRSPTRDGLRAIARTPALWLAEIAWRWTSGLASIILVVLAGVALVRSLHVSAADMVLLRSDNPWLAAAVLSGVIQNVGSRQLRIVAVLTPAVALLWTFAAALGRAATLNVLLREPSVRFRGLLGLSFLRAAVTLAAILGVLGAALAAGYGVAPTPDAGQTMRTARHMAVIFLPIGAAVLLVWSLLNWVLSLAPILAALAGRDTMSAIAETLRMLRPRAGAFLRVSTCFGLAHTALLIAATIAALGMITVARPPAIAFALVIAVAAVYFALVDFLYIARLAAYVAIADDAQAPASVFLIS